MSTVTLTGTYGKADANPATGYVEIVPMITVPMLSTIVVQDPVHADLDGEGKFSVDIYPSDDPDWASIEPVPYIFREFVNGQTMQWMAYVNAPGPVDMSELVPLTEAPAFPTVDPADYQLRSEKGEPNGYVGLDMQGRIVNPKISGAVFTGSNTVPDVPLNTVGDQIANLDYAYGTMVNGIQGHNLGMHRAFVRENPGVANVPDQWTEVGYLNVAAHEPGTWFFTVSIVWEFDTTNRSAMFRFSQDDGATWGDEFSIEPADATDVHPFSYLVPRISQGNASVVRMQARKELGAGGTLSTRYCDLTFFRVA